MEYADLATRAQIDVEGLVVDSDVPAAELRAAHAQQNAIQLSFTPASFAGSGTGQAVLADGAPAQATVHVSALDLAQALAIARRKVPGLDALESARDMSGSPRRQSSPGTGRPRSTSRSRAARSSTQLPGPWSCRRAHVALTAWDSSRQGERPRRRFDADDAHAQIELTDPTRLTAASARATLDLAQWFPWLAARLPLEVVEAMSGKVEVTLKRLALRFDRPQQADFEAVATPRNVSASLKALPGRLRHGHRTRRDNAAAPELGSLRESLGESKFVDVRAELELKPQPRVLAASGRASVELAQWLPMLRLDDVTTLTGKLDVALARLALRFDRPQDAAFRGHCHAARRERDAQDAAVAARAFRGSVRVDSHDRSNRRCRGAPARCRYPGFGDRRAPKPSLDVALSQGTLGEKAVRWALERAGIAARFEPRTPLRFSAPRVAWAAQGPGSGCPHRLRRRPGARRRARLAP